MPEPPQRVDRENVQGLVLTPYRYRLSRHLFFSLPEGVDGRRFLRAIVPNITHGAIDLKLHPPWLCNVGLTCQGLRRIGCDEALIGELDVFFREGPYPDTMGDMRDSPSARPKWWDGQWKTNEIHLTVQIYAREPGDLEGATEEIINHATVSGWVELLPRKMPDYQGSRRLDGAALPRAQGDNLAGAKVHFGYRDGLSQFEVAWDGEPTNGKLDRAHFLLGYSKPDPESSAPPNPAEEFFRDSSYFVLRWIQQDVAAFERFLTDAAPQIAPERPLAEGREFVAAKLLGRWRDGTPLTLSPERPNASLSTKYFGYKELDVEGLRCPFSAHIRVVNPRDQIMAREATEIPRVIRRGMPYGPEWPEGQIADDELDRGIIGVFLFTSIRHQCYTLFRWISETNFSPVFKGDRLHDQDSLCGNRRVERASRTLSLPRADGELLVSGLPDFIRTRGTAFFLLPSMRVLRHLAG